MVYYPIDLLFFNIPLLYYSIKLRSTIFAFFSGGIYLCLGISLSFSVFSALFVTVPKLFWDEVLVTFIMLSTILLPIKSPIASAVFWIVLFEVV